MIVPAMTLEHIRKEIDNDFPMVMRKSVHVTKKLARQYAQSRKEKELNFYFNYCSKQKNNWIYLITLTKKEAITAFLVYYYGQRGLTTLMPVRPGNLLVHCTAHFFNRFNERRQLNLVQPLDVVRVFMREIRTFHYTELEEPLPGIFKIFVKSATGCPLGMYNKNLKLLKFNTFITNDMMHHDQLMLEEDLKKTLEKYQDHSALLE